MFYLILENVIEFFFFLYKQEPKMFALGVSIFYKI